MLEHQWHHLPTQEVAHHLNSNLETGLTSNEVTEGQNRFGPNQLTGKQGKSAWMRFLQQFNQPLLYILLAAGVVTALLQEWVDSGAIIGFVQESKAESAFAKRAVGIRCLGRICHHRSNSHP